MLGVVHIHERFLPFFTAIFRPFPAIFRLFTSWKGQEADALRPHPFQNGFTRFQLPPNNNHEHIKEFPVPSG
jgi:hypothetical protein